MLQKLISDVHGMLAQRVARTNINHQHWHEWMGASRAMVCRPVNASDFSINFPILRWIVRLYDLMSYFTIFLRSDLLIASCMP